MTIFIFGWTISLITCDSLSFYFWIIIKKHLLISRGNLKMLCSHECDSKIWSIYQYPINKYIFKFKKMCWQNTRTRLLKTYTTSQKLFFCLLVFFVVVFFAFFWLPKKLILLFSKDPLSRSKVTVNTFISLRKLKICILINCSCSFKLKKMYRFHQNHNYSQHWQ